jgi:hypothetical protein
MPKNRSRENKDVDDMYSALESLQAKLKNLSSDRRLPKVFKKLES